MALVLDIAEAARVYAQRSKPGKDVEMDAAEIVVRAERKLERDPEGELAVPQAFRRLGARRGSKYFRPDRATVFSLDLAPADVVTDPFTKAW